MSKLILVIGLPSSGKSSYSLSLGGNVIEFAQLRKSVTGQFQFHPETEGLVHHLAQRSVHYYLSKNETVIIDGELHSAELRSMYILMAKKMNATVEVHWLDISIDVIKKRLFERNLFSKEEQRVDFSYLYQISNQFEFPTIDEGIDQIIYISE